MNADAVARYQKDALTGHRPTWKMGANRRQEGQGRRRGRSRRRLRSVQHVLRAQRPRPLAAGSGRRCRRGQARNPQSDERRAQGAAGDGLGPDATLETVKAKYKALVKQHHPDANGGDRSTEDRLIEIIKAYNYLKTVVRGASLTLIPRSRPSGVSKDGRTCASWFGRAMMRSSPCAAIRLTPASARYTPNSAGSAARCAAARGHARSSRRRGRPRRSA